MGINVDELDDAVRVYTKKRPTKANIKTQPYPGFPTDMQPQMAVLLSIAEGTSILTENVWDNRFQYVNELKKLGAEIKIEGRSAIIEGVDKLYGSPLNSTDLRGGAAMIIAGLCADGVTEVHCLEHVDRGYENIEDKLRALGAEIERVEE
jgi:UDP-N-acetylglucosamine 1-carboxyvinyltransferase